jgi:hypothetical protein
VPLAVRVDVSLRARQVLLDESGDVARIHDGANVWEAASLTYAPPSAAQP